MKVSEQIIQVLDALCEKFGIAVDWTSTNVLPYFEILCGKFIKWEITTSIFYMVFWSLLAGIAWPIVKPYIEKAKKDEWDYDYCGSPWIATVGIIMACIFTLVAVINFACQSYDIIQAITFPEKTIYDYISNLISSK